MAPQHKRMLTIAMASTLLALALTAALTVLTGVLSHPTASGAHLSASGFASQDLDGANAWTASGQALRASVEPCAGLPRKYRFDRNDLTYTTGDGALRAGGRISLYLITDDDDEYAPGYRRMPNS
jgi:hypothetical protein